MKKATNYVIVLILALAIILPSAFAVRASVGGARAFINAELDGTNPWTVERTITAINDNPYDISVFVQTDPQYEKLVEFIEPTKVNLTINQTYDFKYILKIEEAGQYNIPILVGFDGNNSKAGIAADIKVSAYCAKGIDPKICEKKESTDGGTDDGIGDKSPLFLILIALGILTIIGILIYVIFNTESKK